MPRGSAKSTLRRYNLYRTLRTAPLAMRPYTRYINRGLECRTSLESESDKCGECIRVSQPYSLIVTPQEFASLDSQLAKLDAKIQRAREAKRKAREREQESRGRLARLKTQRQKLLERKGEMISRELRNIKELKIDEALASLRPLPSSPTGFS
jgi:hypothetical protein